MYDTKKKHKNYSLPEDIIEELNFLLIHEQKIQGRLLTHEEFISIVISTYKEKRKVAYEQKSSIINGNGGIIHANGQ